MKAFSRQAAVTERWGYPFWEVVADMAAQDLNRAQVAAALGYNYVHFWELLGFNPDKDPFPIYGVVANYIRDTGETFRAALERMAAAGYSLRAAAREIGFTQGHALQYAMRTRGIEVQFKRAEPKPPRIRPMAQPKLTMREMHLAPACPVVCDICGKARGGMRPVSHAKCSKIRQARGFSS
jgi:hypothetical protein